jgi:MraZ protein
MGNLSSNARNLSRAILGNSFEVSIDKAGRVLLPKQLAEMVGIDKEVTLVGVGDKIEVHATEQ